MPCNVKAHFLMGLGIFVEFFVVIIAERFQPGFEFLTLRSPPKCHDP